MENDQSNTGVTPAQLRRNDDVVARQLENEVVLVHLKTNRIYSLSETGARLWELIDGKRTSLQIEEVMLEEFEIDPGRLREEIERLLSLLHREGLVDRGDGA